MTARRKQLLPLSDAARTVALLEREELLSEEAQHLMGVFWRRRCEIDQELAEIRRLLEGLGLKNKTVD